MLNLASRADSDTARFFFPRQARLNRSADYKQVFAKARKFTSRYFTVLVRHNDLGYARIGIIASRKNVKKAVLRNGIKRQIRESFRLHHGSLGSRDIVMIARNTAGLASSERLREVIDKHWVELQRHQNLKDECA